MDSEDERTLWCGNLPDRVSEELIYELFLHLGPVEKIRLPKDRDGRNKSYAFIIFRHACSVPYAKKVLDGAALYGRQIKLQFRENSVAGNGEPGYEARQNMLMHQRSMSVPANMNPLMMNPALSLINPFTLPSYLQIPRYLQPNNNPLIRSMQMNKGRDDFLQDERHSRRGDRRWNDVKDSEEDFVPDRTSDGRNNNRNGRYRQERDWALRRQQSHNSPIYDHRNDKPYYRHLNSGRNERRY